MKPPSHDPTGPRARPQRRGLPEDERRMLAVERWLSEGGAGAPPREDLVEFVGWSETRIEDLLLAGRPVARLLQARNEARVLLADMEEEGTP